MDHQYPHFRGTKRVKERKRKTKGMRRKGRKIEEERRRVRKIRGNRLKEVNQVERRERER